MFKMVHIITASELQRIPSGSLVNGKEVGHQITEILETAVCNKAELSKNVETK